MVTKTNDRLEVWIDSNIVDGISCIGTLHHEHGHIRFNYNKEWLKHPNCFNIDPHLSLDKGEFHPRPEIGSFGMLLDSSPDRWGQTLMKRREAQDAKDEGRKARNLHAWDFLIGVQDQTRQGALRFKREGSDFFLGTHDLPAPPVTDLRELEEVARKLSDKHIDDLDALRRWLTVLVAPGSSLGGARPKANFTEKDGSLWIAKFPAKDEPLDVGAWEMLIHRLADRAGIDVPPANLIKFASEHHTFCIKRFDRSEDGRIFYASAMTALQAQQSEGMSYLDIAKFIQDSGDSNFINNDLEQLFRRVVFNVMVGNKDDHLRNHGFILNKGGWRLSPAFDVNPNIDKAEHVLCLDESDNRPDLRTAIDTAEYYNLSSDDAIEIVKHIGHYVSCWDLEANKMGISRADIEIMRSSFCEFDGNSSLLS